MTPMPHPRIGQTGQKYPAPANTAVSNQMAIITADTAR